jgi:hypothetical protein
MGKIGSWRNEDAAHTQEPKSACQAFLPNQGFRLKHIHSYQNISLHPDNEYGPFCILGGKKLVFLLEILVLREKKSFHPGTREADHLGDAGERLNAP